MRMPAYHALHENESRIQLSRYEESSRTRKETG